VTFYFIVQLEISQALYLIMSMVNNYYGRFFRVYYYIGPQKTIACVDVVSSDIFHEDQEKRDYARSILKKTRQSLDWFRPSRRVITLRPVSLYY
jgi:hypothetical protein